MARKKRTSKVLVKLNTRLAGMKSISQSLDLGNGLDVTTIAATATTLETSVNSYNEDLSTFDKKTNDLNTFEKSIGQICRRILQAVGSAYGYDSNEYEMVGGVRTSERKKPKKGNGGDDPTPPDEGG